MEQYIVWIFANTIENNLLASVASVATIGTILWSAVRYFSDQSKEKKMASQNLYLELENTLQSLDSKKFPSDIYSISMKNKRTLYFISRDLNHDFYDSMIFSGKINFLEPSLQQKIQDVFKEIKAHNRCLFIAKRMIAKYKDDLISEKTYRYCKTMNEGEALLQQEIPKVLEKLKSHFM